MVSNETAHDHDVAVREHWDASAGVYDSLASHGLFSEAERRAWCGLLERLLPPRRCRVLDVGTGTGFLAFRLAELGHDVVGIDVSREMLAVARSRSPKGAIDFVEGSADLADAGIGRFDAIVSRHLLWTLPKPEATLRRWHDALEPCGIAIAIDGTWFASTSLDRAAAKTGNLLRRLTRASHERNDSVYARHGSDVFPLLGASSPEPSANAFARAGFVDVRSEYLDGIDAVERTSMTLADRLANRWRRFVVEGRAA